MYFSCHALELAFPVDPVGVMHPWLAADSWVSAQLVPWCYFSAEKLGYQSGVTQNSPCAHCSASLCQGMLSMGPLCKVTDTGVHGKLCSISTDTQGCARVGGRASSCCSGAVNPQEARAGPGCQGSSTAGVGAGPCSAQTRRALGHCWLHQSYCGPLVALPKGFWTSSLYLSTVADSL